MKDFFNIFIVIILTGFAIGISYMQYTQLDIFWGCLYIPWIFISIAWGIKINNDYK
jgi:hypothetical protein